MMKQMLPGLKDISRFYLPIALIFIGIRSNAQAEWKDYLIGGSAMFVSGMIDGTIQSMHDNYQRGFKRQLPGVNDQFWNPRVSWKNKYKNHDEFGGPAFPGSTGPLVFVTDGYHLLKAARETIDVSSMAYFINRSYIRPKFVKKGWKRVATDFIVLAAIRSIGYHVTYSLIFRPVQSN